MEKLHAELARQNRGLIFCNLVDFDMLYGHRKDVEGFARSLEEFDALLGRASGARCKPRDLLLITADHGCDPDPAWPTTDHSREYVPILTFSPGGRHGVALGIARHPRRHGPNRRRKFRRSNSARKQFSRNLISRD